MARGVKRADIDVGLTEVLRVGEVINLRPELQLHPLEKLEVFEDREIHASLFRSIQLRTRLVSSKTYRLAHKSTEVDPVGVSLVIRRVGCPWNNVGTIRRYQSADVRRNWRRGIQNRKRHTGLVESQQVGLPPAYSQLAHAASRFSERELVIETI